MSETSDDSLFAPLPAQLLTIGKIQDAIQMLLIVQTWDKLQSVF